MKDDAKQPVVVVAGDGTIDWNIARTRGEVLHIDNHARACWQRGGALLLADLVALVADNLRDAGIADYAVKSMDAPREPVHPGDRRFHHSYAIFAKYLRDPQSPKEPLAWRVDEFLGLDRRASDKATVEEWQHVREDSPDAALIILDDAGLGFREQRELWPAALDNTGSRPWVLLKVAGKPVTGALWDRLNHDRADRLIVVMTIHDLRRAHVQVSQELSWERAAQDLAWELVHNPEVKALSRCAHVVVSFGPAGAFVLSRATDSGDMGAPTHGRFQSTPPKCTLVFDPALIEGMWEQSYPGRMIGYTTTLTAGIARELMRSPDAPDIVEGVCSGLTAMRVLHREGFGCRETPDSETYLTFPIEAVAGALAGTEDQPFAAAVVPVPAAIPPSNATESTHRPPPWTILGDTHPGDLENLAEEIVLEGARAALRNVPLGEFGKLLTVDRQEIEAFRAIRALVEEHAARPSERQPLSIAVFGAPGSGKSFGVTQVATSLLPDLIEKIEFNLSQLGSPADLMDAFHRVRDVGLSGKLPLVFWDEFDTALDGRPLGWLRYFLAPMQDGSFQKGQVVHPIGRAIFVFAGGTARRMEDFGAREMSAEDFRHAKGPDFVSRLRGFVNVRGPNPDPRSESEAGGADPDFIVRRAILLRSLLERIGKDLLHGGTLDMDRGVLRAFLTVSEYRHGARSLESILAMSRLAGETSFERSCLPTQTQLDLHVDGQEFLAIVRQIELSGEILEDVAEAAHELYCEGLQKQGSRTEASQLPYADLPEHFKEQNRANVRDIQAKLQRLGYVMVPAQGSEARFSFSAEEIETMAVMEHERYVKANIESGWTWGPESDSAKKINKTLVPWEELPQEERKKDHDLVSGIPEIVARAGYTIARLRGQATVS